MSNKNIRIAAHQVKLYGNNDEYNIKYAVIGISITLSKRKYAGKYEILKRISNQVGKFTVEDKPFETDVSCYIYIDPDNEDIYDAIEWRLLKIIKSSNFNYNYIFNIITSLLNMKFKDEKEVENWFIKW